MSIATIFRKASRFHHRQNLAMAYRLVSWLEGIPELPAIILQFGN